MLDDCFEHQLAFADLKFLADPPDLSPSTICVRHLSHVHTQLELKFSTHLRIAFDAHVGLLVPGELLEVHEGEVIGVLGDRTSGSPLTFTGGMSEHNQGDKALELNQNGIDISHILLLFPVTALK